MAENFPQRGELMYKNCGTHPALYTGMNSHLFETEKALAAKYYAYQCGTSEELTEHEIALWRAVTRSILRLAKGKL
jgi:hypothetical protein